MLLFLLISSLLSVTPTASGDVYETLDHLMVDSVKDVLGGEETPASKMGDDEGGEWEGRQLFSFDRASAFNTSVAFTIPLFSFTLPGAKSATEGDVNEGNAFGVLAFVALFLLAGLGVAIYTTTQGGNGDDPRKIINRHPIRDALGEYLDEDSLAARVVTAIEELPEAMQAQSCAQLAFCSAFSNQQNEYGWTADVLRIYVNFMGDPDSPLTKDSKIYSDKDEYLCREKFSCVVQPLYWIHEFGLALQSKFL